MRLFSFMSSVEIEVEKCKGCGLCVSVCPKGVLKMFDDTNDHGYFYLVSDGDCSGCRNCYLVCPDACVSVFRKK